MESRNLDDLILISSCLARDARGRRFGAGSAGRSGDWSGNQKENLAADSLQIAQTAKRDSIGDCSCAPASRGLSRSGQRSDYGAKAGGCR
jgi:hypothetical protein